MITHQLNEVGSKKHYKPPVVKSQGAKQTYCTKASVGYYIQENRGIKFTISTPNSASKLLCKIFHKIGSSRLVRSFRTFRMRNWMLRKKYLDIITGKMSTKLVRNSKHFIGIGYAHGCNNSIQQIMNKLFRLTSHKRLGFLGQN